MKESRSVDQIVRKRLFKGPIDYDSKRNSGTRLSKWKLSGTFRAKESSACNFWRPRLFQESNCLLCGRFLGKKRAHLPSNLQVSPHLCAIVSFCLTFGLDLHLRSHKSGCQLRIWFYFSPTTFHSYQRWISSLSSSSKPSFILYNMIYPSQPKQNSEETRIILIWE